MKKGMTKWQKGNIKKMRTNSEIHIMYKAKDAYIISGTWQSCSAVQCSAVQWSTQTTNLYTPT